MKKDQVMSRFESNVKHIPYPQQVVYANLSDMNNLAKVRDRIPEDKVKDIRFDADSVSMYVPPVGEISMHIINREEPKCIKFETTNSPVPFYMWIQLLPVTLTSCKMKLTVEAELNPFIKGMVKGPLQESLEKIADLLAIVHYQ